MSMLNIGRNLASALRHLRYLDTPRALWVDAICINQQDIPGRNEQVQRMGRIYKLARRVVVWLGEASEENSLALSIIGYLGAQLEFSIDYFFIRSPDAEQPDWYLIKSALPYDQKTWHALESLFQRPWFERVWVIQEIGLGNRFSVMQCGHNTVLWILFRRAVNCLDSKVLPSLQIQGRLGDMATLTAETKWTALTLLQIAREKKCLNPRDKLYGILSIAPPRLAALIRPDYLLPPAEIYKDAFLVALDLSRRLNWLRFSDPNRQTPGIPSWVSDWVSLPSMRVARLSWCYFASAFSSAETKYTPPKSLEFSGVKLATVLSVGEPIVGDVQQLFKAMSVSEPENFHETTYVTGESMLDAFVSTFTLNIRKEIYVWNSFPTFDEWKKLFATKTPADSADVWLSRLCRWIIGMAFITTNEGYMGLSVPWAKPVDIISIPLGCEVPIILRPKPSSNNEYQVIGDCYVHGVMFGEALLGPLPSAYKIQITTDPSGVYTHSFANEDPGSQLLGPLDDPRLGTMPEEWEQLQMESTRDDPVLFVKYRNMITGEVINSDPRALPEALDARGVGLRTFNLV